MLQNVTGDSNAVTRVCWQIKLAKINVTKREPNLGDLNLNLNCNLKLNLNLTLQLWPPSLAYAGKSNLQKINVTKREPNLEDLNLNLNCNLKLNLNLTFQLWPPSLSYAGKSNLQSINVTKKGTPFKKMKGHQKGSPQIRRTTKGQLEETHKTTEQQLKKK